MQYIYTNTMNNKNWNRIMKICILSITCIIIVLFLLLGMFVPAIPAEQNIVDYLVDITSWTVTSAIVFYAISLIVFISKAFEEKENKKEFITTCLLLMMNLAILYPAGYLAFSLLGIPHNYLW